MQGLRMRLTGALLGACLLYAASDAWGGAASAAPGLLARAHAVAAVSGAARGLGLSTVGLQGWKVQSSAIATQTGAQVSMPGFPAPDWLKVRPDDAGAPGTEIEALLQNGRCPHDPSFPVNQGPALNSHNVFFSDNLQRCFGLETSVGPDTIPEFQVPWWFQTDFTPNLQPGQTASLVVNGVVGQADLWVDGTEVATQATIRGAYASHTFDITSLVRPGTNSLALELFPNDPNSMLTLDTVDWNQIAPDNNTGIQFPVQLHVAGALALSDTHVMQNDAPDLSSSALTVKTDVTNGTRSPQTGTVSATVTPPSGGGAPIQLSRSVTVPAASTQTVSFAPSDYPQLTIQQPQVWWPYQMGGQPLYTLSASVSPQGGSVTDAAPPASFGIRTITTYLTAPSGMAPDGVRVFEVNGRPFVVRGGGWSENLFLHYSSSDMANQVAIIRSLGLNTIRTEGKEVPGDFYEQLDRAGILVDAGFQCCDAWAPDPTGQGVTAQDYQVMYLSSLTIGRRLRDHPSVMNFSWSDNAPIPEQEVVSLQGFAQAGFQDPIIASAEYNPSALLGPAGEKEGPYDWVPPSYWYDTTHASHNATDNDPTMTNVGGSWGFDSEQSAGDTVPTTDSLQRFLSATDQAALWQQPDAHQYHLNYESTAGEHVGYAFGTLDNLDQAVTTRYGQWSSLAQYVEEAQVQNYEDTRAQFEAFVDHWNDLPTPSTGTIYWQLNKGWPTLLWDLYNNDYDQAGSYFGAKKANESLHALFAYDDDTVTVDNLSGVAQPDVSVEARVYDLAGRVLDDQTAASLTVPSQGVRNAVVRPRVPAATTPPAAAQTFWVELLLKQHGSVVDRNVYWLSTQQDVVDWQDTQGNPQALTSSTTAGLPQYADLRALQGLPQATVSAVASTRFEAGRAVTSVTITNTSASPTVGFFLRADVRRGNAGGQPQPGDNQILPITWSDNDVTLWPGESETLSATYAASLLDDASPVVSLGGWNVPGLVVAAPETAAAAAAGRAAGAAAGVQHFGGADGTPLMKGSATPGAGGSAVPAGPATARHGGVAWTIASAAHSPVGPRGSFTQGDSADTYTLTVTNSGSAPTDGSTTVTLTDVVDPALGVTSIAGSGWSCDTSNSPTLVCTEIGGPGGTPAVLAPGQSYPPLTLTVQVPPTAGYGTQDSTAGLHVTNAVSVTGGAAARPSAAIAPETPIAGLPDLTADDALASAFHQGDAADVYQITVINQGARATAGAASPVVAAVSVPAGETAVALYGSGWSCSLATTTCSSPGVVAGENGEAPPITLVVRVSPTAPSQVTQTVTVSGGGETVAAATVSAQTAILPPAPGSTPPVIEHRPDLAVTALAAAGGVPYGPFAPGGTATYTITVANVGFGPTSGTATLEADLPAGLTALEMSGGGDWACTASTAICTTRPGVRLDVGRQDTITLRVAVAAGAPASVLTWFQVSGGGEVDPANDTYADPSYVRVRQGAH